MSTLKASSSLLLFVLATINGSFQLTAAMPAGPSRAKGKAKATSSADVAGTSERSPLLSPSSRARSAVDSSDPQHGRLNRRFVFNVVSVVLLSLLLSAILFLVLLGASFRPSKSEYAALPSTAFAYSPPDSISVLNITEHGVYVNISLKCGIDADRALGIQPYASAQAKDEATQRGDRGVGAVWWEKLRRSSAHWFMRDVRQVQVEIPSSVYIFPHHFTSPPLLAVTVPDLVNIPLINNVPPTADKDDWLQSVSILAVARPIASTGELWKFVQSAWAAGQAKVVVGVEKVNVQLPTQGPWWSKWVQGSKEDLTLNIEMPVPHLPGLPRPGKPLNISSLVTLVEYSFETTPSALRIAASASIPNPLPAGINATLPFGIPFTISLPPTTPNVSETQMAQVVTSPLPLVGYDIAPNLTVHISGEITSDLSPPKGSNGTSPLSTFLQRYLHGLSNPITVRGMSAVPTFTPSPSPPAWLLSSLPSLSLPLSFPGPSPKPKIIQSVAIEQMRLSEAGGKMRASGTVVAAIQLPPGMEGVRLIVNAVKPDVLIFDGPAPEVDGGDDDDEEPPEKAFGHIHPEEYLPAVSTQIEGSITVRAPLHDVPLDVLPGRDKILSDFVGKVVFKGGALAGIMGDADVEVQLNGVTGSVGLEGLPVRGETWVGRQRSRPWRGAYLADGTVEGL